MKSFVSPHTSMEAVKIAALARTATSHFAAGLIDQHCANISVSIVSIAVIFAELKEAVTEMKGRLDYLLKNDTATTMEKLQVLLADRTALLKEQSQAKDKIN